MREAQALQSSTMQQNPGPRGDQKHSSGPSSPAASKQANLTGRSALSIVLNRRDASQICGNVGLFVYKSPCTFGNEGLGLLQKGVISGTHLSGGQPCFVYAYLEYPPNPPPLLCREEPRVWLAIEHQEGASRVKKGRVKGNVGWLR